mmetsp:Transcript_8526/g.18171  ORF Transcript_8526/g.18171 Transcript_8526/m.18171 type:complete len:250 (-) Transcript_8526:43-792(-)
MLYVADIKTVNQFYGVFGPLWGGRKCSRCRRRKRLFVEIMHELVKTKEGDSEPMKILRVKQSSVLFFCILQETRLIGSSSTLRLVLGNRRSSTTNLLALVLGLLDSLTTLFLLLLKSLADKSVFRLELTQCILCIVDHTESGGLSSSEFSSETEKNYQFGIRLVHASDDLLQFSAGNIGASGVDDVDNHLLPGEKWITHKFARLDDNTLLRHGVCLAVPSFKFGKLGLPLLEHFRCCVVFDRMRQELRS